MRPHVGWNPSLAQERHLLVLRRPEPCRRLSQHEVHGHEFAHDRVPFRRTAVPVVFLPDRRVERAGVQMEDVTLSSVRQHADVLSSHAPGQKTDGRLTMRGGAERHIMSAEKVPAVQRDEHKELRLTSRVAEHLQGMLTVQVGGHRSSFPML
jgi:hypothetical protein